ncbi:hypothetical protein C6P40_003377 [Pichia californica]|uniref:FAD/NAD(P)-binding domain-containing protein n=1 Tax=Pichia californica TaxID=460514 RepID=A0A9P6WQT2_9ASCO|nr:hypothetical protein C6P42_004441 [[Candida] californica]KAG0690263.1 hypothetical protein C6P40_003377 [[Candida] californica]
MNIDKIAIIGGGPSGLVALNEFLHTAKDGTSTINSFITSENKLPFNPAFKDIVLFEQNSNIGGTWNYSKKTDPLLPTNKDYSLPNNIRPSLSSPTENELLGTTFEKPLIRSIQSDLVKEDLLWNKSGVYDDLFTNVGNRLMRFSSGYDIKSNVLKDNPYNPFIKHQNVLDYLNKFTEKNNLKSYIRFNSSIEKIYKKKNKWIIVVVNFDRKNNIEKWYSEKFDSVLIATGRFNIPFVPFIENMDKFIKKNPNSISHTKSFRNIDDYENKKVLIVGSSIGAIDLLQYMIPKCKEVWLSSNSTKKITIKPKDNILKQGQWIYDILNDENAKFKRCCKIKKFSNDGNSIEFEDGEKINGFDKILFATGYHLHYPFLEIPENKDKNYIKILSGKKNESNYAFTKADNAFLYVFTVNEPTLCYTGIAHNPLLFLTAEANAIAIAGVWSNSKKLPSINDQKKWCKEKLDVQVDGLQMFDEYGFKTYAKELYQYAPEKRINLINLVQDEEVDKSRNVLKKIFYEISSS